MRLHSIIPLRVAAGYEGAAGVERLAKKVGRSASWIRRVEAGYRPPEHSARKLAAALGCDPTVLLGRSVSAPRCGRLKKTADSGLRPNFTLRAASTPRLCERPGAFSTAEREQSRCTQTN